MALIDRHRCAGCGSVVTVEFEVTREVRNYGIQIEIKHLGDPLPECIPDIRSANKAIAPRFKTAVEALEHLEPLDAN